MTKDKLITVATFPSSIDAHLAKTKLESEGIMVFLFDENMVSLQYNISMGGIKLKTLTSDAQKAQEILQSVEGLPYTNVLEAPLTCPRCNSPEVKNALDTRQLFQSLMGFLKSLFTFGLMVPSAQKYRCRNCGLVFEQ